MEVSCDLVRINTITLLTTPHPGTVVPPLPSKPPSGPEGSNLREPDTGGREARRLREVRPRFGFRCTCVCLSCHHKLLPFPTEAVERLVPATFSAQWIAMYLTLFDLFFFLFFFFDIYIYTLFSFRLLFFLIFPPLLSIDVRSSSNTRARARVVGVERLLVAPRLPPLNPPRFRNPADSRRLFLCYLYTSSHRPYYRLTRL